MSSTSAKAAEWRSNWPLVLAAMAGMSLVSVPIYSIGLFMAPLDSDLGWTRAQILIGLTIFSILAVPLSPLVGVWIDRWGPRRLAVPGVIAAGLAYAAFGTTSASLLHWGVLWVIYTFAALAIKTTVWTAAVSSAFTHGRGLALAATLSGVAIAQMLTPPLARIAIDMLGWRSAFFALGLVWSAAVFAIVFLFFRVRPVAGPAAADAPCPSAPLALHGLTVGEALRTRAIWCIAGAILLSATLLTALTVHQVPYLTEAGFSRVAAAQMASVCGGASLLGKFASGWVLDRGETRWIGWASQLVLGTSCLVLLTCDGALGPALLSMAMMGYAMGANLQISIYFTTRYAGLRHYGKIFGGLSSLLAFASGVGPLIGGLIFDLSGSYDALLIAAAPVTAIAALLLFRLGPYPVWGEDHADT